MGETTAIEWTDRTFNPWIGCQKVSPGCDHCYAEALMDHRYGKVQWGPHGERKRTSAGNWRGPVKWNREAATTGKRRVFCASLADVFDNRVPAEWRRDLFDLIRATPNLEWQLLTKRPENVLSMVAIAGGLPRNAALGTTVEDQARAKHRVPFLQAFKDAFAPAYVFLSCEPLIGPVAPDLRDIDWVIVGGESGPGARPMDLAWARQLQAQCASAGVPFFMKQIDKKAAIPPDLFVRQFPLPDPGEAPGA